jgi:hypothetical protein
MKMSKSFEDTFSELQADMVSICLEYVENRADNIFIHCSWEQGVSACNVFYCINGSVVRRSKINDVQTNEQRHNFRYDTSDIRQQKLLTIVNDDLEKIESLCHQNKRPMPTEIKIKYDVTTNSMKANYCYDLLYTNNPDKRVSDIFNDWFEEIKRYYQ